jgi:uncharacterized phage protein gp47/JayE
MAVLIKSRGEILSNIVLALQQTGLLTDLRPGHAAFALAQVSSEELADIYNSIKANTALGYLSTSRGPFLDLLSDFLQVARLPEQPALVLKDDRNVRFFVSTGTLVAIIPTKQISQGTELSTDDGVVVYHVLENTPFTDVATEVFVSVSSNGTGDSQNVGKGQLNTHNLGIALLQVENTAAISTASDVETDDQLRARLQDAMLTRATGNTASLREAVNIVSGVAEVRIQSHAQGPGTVDITVIPVSNAATTRLSALARVNIDAVRSAGTLIDIRGPRFVPVEIILLLRFRADTLEGDKPTFKRQVEQAILDYLASLRIGQELILKEMIQQVMDVSEQILDFETRCFIFGRRPQVPRNYVPDPDQILIPDPEIEHPIQAL